MWLDDEANRAFLVQTKFRKKLLATTENRGDVLGFSDLPGEILGPPDDLRRLLDGIDPLVGERIERCRERCLKKGYRLELYYVTTGRVAGPLAEEARSRARRGSGGMANLNVMDGRRVLAVLDDYLDGVAPPIPSVDIPVQASGESAMASRYDPNSGIETWVFTANGQEIGALFKHAGIRIFARNVRGFLGNTDINKAMAATLHDQPEYFVYFNNGVTIVCDDAEWVQAKGVSLLRVANPQIINGQQTTRALSLDEKLASKASVLVRVIRIPRDGDDGRDTFERLVSQIVEATNWQNQIRASDLMSNDRQQIVIERELRKVGYHYLRKRQTKGEARRALGTRRGLIISKEEVAQAVAACELDPGVVREGREGLFEERNYKSVFPSGDAYFYLSRYWLMKNVLPLARGNFERTYARWVVIHFLWSDLGTALRKHPRQLCAVNEHPRKYLRVHEDLDRAIERVVLAAVKFYRAERKTESGILDPAAFYNRRGRAKQFTAFWTSAANPHRRHYESAAERFVASLAAVEL